MFSGQLEVRLPAPSVTYDAVLAARTTCTDPASQLACARDTVATNDEVFNVTASSGVPIYAIVDGFGGAVGNYRLRLNPP